MYRQIRGKGTIDKENSQKSEKHLLKNHHEKMVQNEIKVNNIGKATKERMGIVRGKIRKETVISESDNE